MTSSDQLVSEKEKLENFMYHYSNCLIALGEIKDLMVQGKDISAINRLRDVTKEMDQISHLVKEVHDEM
ncbi:MAG: hypothetical protein O2887_07000 [Bacteroidetes bacterium]|nr:hypothetical protein [Bacteroidota bacterium]MDA1120227.1 hypothetical protein [Bacteroidota bacterium]